MKEVSEADLVITELEEIRWVQNVLSAERRSVRKGRADLVLMFKSKQHAAIKIADSTRRFTHLATAFAQTEYELQETPD